MTPLFTPLALALLLAAAPDAPVATVRPPEARPRLRQVAVLQLEDLSGELTAVARQLGQVVTAEALKRPGFRVISAAEVASLLGLERQRELLGCAEGSSCLAELGGALGADYVLAGTLGRLGGRFRLDLRLIDGRKSRVVASEGDFARSEEALVELAEAQVARLFTKLEGPRPEPVGGLAVAEPAAASSSRTPAFVGLGATVALAAGAGVMTFLASRDYDQAVADYRLQPSVPSAAGGRLSWEPKLADGLWVGTAIAAGVTTWLFVRDQ